MNRNGISWVMAAMALCMLMDGCAESRGLRVAEQVAEVNDVSLVYEVMGEGRPVVLLHGNGGSHHDLDTLSAQLVGAGYRVWALDSRGQGANVPLTEYHYKDMAEDVFAFCRMFGIERPIVYGWSDGGIVALLLEIMHPGTVSCMAISGANISPDCAADPDVWASFTADSLNPLVAMMLHEPNISPEEMASIQCPVLVCAGENDLISEEHTRMIAAQLPKGELLLLPGEDHSSYIWHNPKMGEILLDFLRRTPAEGQQAPELEFVCQLDVTTGPSYAVGNTTKGFRNVVPITGGRFEGPRLRGSILPGGADYQLTDAVTRHTELEAIYDIRTDDGCVIHVRNIGLIAAEAAAEGQEPQVYFRAEPRFEAPADSRYAWLNNALYVCAPTATAPGAAISLRVWMVK